MIGLSRRNSLYEEINENVGLLGWIEPGHELVNLGFRVGYKGVFYSGAFLSRYCNRKMIDDELLRRFNSDLLDAMEELAV